jgi:hypothetical protein
MMFFGFAMETTEKTKFLELAYGIHRFIAVLHRHRGGRAGNINAWYLNTHMVYL